LQFSGYAPVRALRGSQERLAQLEQPAKLGTRAFRAIRRIPSWFPFLWRFPWWFRWWSVMIQMTTLTRAIITTRVIPDPDIRRCGDWFLASLRPIHPRMHRIVGSGIAVMQTAAVR
jgi:hypothetical protein